MSPILLPFMINHWLTFCVFASFLYEYTQNLGNVNSVPLKKKKKKEN